MGEEFSTWNWHRFDWMQILRARKSGKLHDAQLATASENLLQFLRGYNLQLRVGTFARIFIESPSAKVSHMAKAISLHMLIRHFDNKLGTQRLPGKVFSPAPAAFATRHAMFVTVGATFLPGFPGMMGQRILAVGSEKFEQLSPLFLGEAGADANVL